jgi:hypothetical protein
MTLPTHMAHDAVCNLVRFNDLAVGSIKQLVGKVSAVSAAMDSL